MASRYALRQARRSPKPAEMMPRDVHLRLVLPWWANPLAALIILTGTMAAVSAMLPADEYKEWLTPKFITPDLGLVLLILFLAMAIGVFFGSGLSPRARVIDLYLDETRIAFLNKAYRILFVLTLIGYTVWAASAVAQGVGISNLLAVLERSQGAIGELKANARPIGGVTTLTQFAPLAVALNLLLWRAGVRHRPSLVFLFAAALARVFFYAERLALIELVIPAALIGAMILSADPKWQRRLAIAPAIGIPVVWGVFALSEYFRSWVYYEQLTDLPFTEWVTLRLLGYYVTSFNNSALVADAYQSYSAVPWFSAQWLWNFPGVESIIQHPGIAGMAADRWWTYTLTNNANVNFTNTGSFLTTYAEYGLPISIALWLFTGLAFGLIFNALCRGNVPALLLYVALFVGILELPRMIYWTLGRSTPIIIAFVIMAYQWNRLNRKSPTPDRYRV